MRAALLEHLDDEEEHILPIAARSMSPQEWEAVGQHGFSEIDRADLPILFGMLIEDATPEERKEMFARLPLPARMYLRTVGAWQYRLHQGCPRDLTRVQRDLGPHQREYRTHRICCTGRVVPWPRTGITPGRHVATTPRLPTAS